MIQCRCGGLITIGELVNNRERWHCQACGRYEIFHLSPFYGSEDKKAYLQPDPQEVLIFSDSKTTCG